MVPEAYRPLFDRLVRRSLAGEVNWRPTADKQVVAVYFKDFSVTLRRGWDPGDEEEFVRLEIINVNGEEIDGFYSSDGDEDWNDALDLFEAARRKSIRLDEAVDQILRELDKEGPVGTDPPPEPETRDDLPF